MLKLTYMESTGFSVKKISLVLLLGFAFCGRANAQLDTTKWYPVDNVSNSQNECLASAQNSVSGGLLTQTLTSGGAPYSCGTYTGKGYLGAMIVSKAFSFQYGTVTASIQFGQPGNTLRSAVWMWGGGAGSSGAPATCVAALEASPGTSSEPMALCTTNATPSWEIDIAENDSQTNTIFNNWLEWESGTIVAHAFDSAAVETNVNDTFHIYKLQWFSDHLVFSIDNVVTNTVSQAVTVPMFLLVDQEVSNLPTSSPNMTKVDWIHVCSDPNAVCNAGDPTMTFDEEFNQGVIPATPIPNQKQGVTVQGVQSQ